jgi:Cys-tRNA(Pro)/Cys-tRNA(Cys) deacylase
MTPAIKHLQKLGVEHAVREYQTDGSDRNFGEKAAAALGHDPHQVFKTLLVILDKNTRNPAVAIVPVANQLDTKRLAAALGARRAEMADPAIAERKTGYQVGGISPIAQRQQLTTVIDETAQLFDQIYVSAGRRGLELALSPDDLASV